MIDLDLTKRKERIPHMQTSIRVIIALLITLFAASVKGQTLVHLGGLSGYAPDGKGGAAPFAVPDGTVVEILFDGHEIPCVVKALSCTAALPTADPAPNWTVSRVVWLLGIGYTPTVTPPTAALSVPPQDPVGRMMRFSDYWGKAAFR